MSELYANKVCLSPMVRSGTLPLRLLSLRYGADLVYGEEIIDKRIISAVRVPNDVVNAVDFVSRNGDSVVFRTCSEEAGKVVFQIGTADAVLALKAAEAVARDVAAVDINMGCPKHFSVQGGMGAALLRKPEVACDIMKTLRRNLNIPVSCKIRLLPEIQDTVDLARRLEDAGACAVGVHMRQTHERPHDKASWDRLAPVVSALSVPVLANGDVFMHEDINKLRKLSGASSFLIARGALANPSIFRKEGRLPIDQVVREYLKAAAEVDNVFQNTKYNVMRMIPSSLEDAYASGNKYGYAKDAHVVTVPDLAATRNGLQMYSLWDLQNYYNQYQDQFRAKATALEKSKNTEDPTSETLTTLPGAHDRYAENTEREAPKARNNITGKSELFCETCKIQLLSEQDVKLHYKGRKHKNVLRRQTSATISKFVAKAQVEQNPATGESRKVVAEIRQHEGEDKRDVKRTKLEDTTAVANDRALKSTS
ncbi:tRNA-dihydrouridine synthase, putative [Phytophthora infestans T30-4]|uniref:tRNA-dihydrouridine synthase, putative n=1 Tax=Phytophthora infestans (strain T30-4) TaxID=403677 RepID=D0P0N4_PHYIT|nr:tRNA-dihydrouridine synthase, putative [Phytophthora infestans T30-4]EEY53001.1 tRNA-dihydrouridine synthase, putative [Phytophthora infestans T30-4]|eukprot:XP_002896129.1 tRNA-dihydrouridine synthase, putative [Phytophthora infestans T30-4]